MTSERGAANGPDEIVVQCEHASSHTQRHFTGLGQREATSALSKQRHPDILLQTLHLQADRGGRSSEALRRLAVAAEVVGDDQRAQGIEVEILETHRSSRSLLLATTATNVDRTQY